MQYRNVENVYIVMLNAWVNCEISQIQNMHTNFIFNLKVTYINVWGRSVRPSYVPHINETNKICYLYNILCTVNTQHTSNKMQ